MRFVWSDLKRSTSKLSYVLPETVRPKRFYGGQTSKRPWLYRPIIGSSLLLSQKNPHTRYSMVSVDHGRRALRRSLANWRCQARRSLWGPPCGLALRRTANAQGLHKQASRLAKIPACTRPRSHQPFPPQIKIRILPFNPSGVIF